MTTTSTNSTDETTTDRSSAGSVPDVSEHLASGPRLAGDRSSFPSHAQLARTLFEPGVLASLATLTETGHPYTSLVPVSASPGGGPVMCVSALAEHTQNLRRDPRASLLACEGVAAGADPLAFARATLIGTLAPHRPSDADVDRHLAAHPHAIDYIGFDDFSWWRLEVASVRYVGGFGVMGWATGDEFAHADADPVIPHAAPMIAHLNADHADACLEIVRRLAGEPTAVSVAVTAVDRYGITFDVWTASTVAPDVSARVAFPGPLASPNEVRAASVDLVRRASEASRR